MNKTKSKIGFSVTGGIFIGEDIQSNYHKHYAASIIISLGDPFKITTVNQKSAYYKVAIIQKNISYKLESDKKAKTVFIHIVPYSTNGIKLSNKSKPIQKLDIEPFRDCLQSINDWFYSSENNPNTVSSLLDKISMIPQNPSQERAIIDERVQKSFDLIMENEDEKLPISQIAKSVFLSTSHFARLFKKETGMTFRKFVLHSKLIKSIYSMYKNDNLTEASFIGGFADQAHFSRTFKSAFGIKPSTSLK